MNTPNRIPQVYGYGICLVAVVTGLIALPSLIGALFDLRDPLQGRVPGAPVNLHSFDLYKMDVHRRGPAMADAPPAEIPDDATLRTMYEAAKTEQTRYATGQAYRHLTTHGLLMLVAAMLFITHWRWLQRTEGPPGRPVGFKPGG